MRTALRPLPNGLLSELPSLFSGLVGWWPADTLGLADAASVTSWTDASGNGNHLIPGTAPIYKQTIQNGLGIVRFNGTTQYLKCDGLASVVSGTAKAWSIAFAARPTSSGAGTVWSSGKAADGNPYERIFNAPALALTKRQDGAGASISNSARAFGANVWSVGMTIATGSQMLSRLDGALLAVAADALAACTQDEFSVGTWRRTATADFWPGDIAEIAFWNRALTEKEMRAVETGLRTKWAIAMR